MMGGCMLEDVVTQWLNRLIGRDPAPFAAVEPARHPGRRTWETIFEAWLAGRQPDRDKLTR